MLRANLSIGWNESMTAPIKQVAEMEKDLSKYLFSDASDFIKKIITVMLDEPSTRDMLGKFTMKVNNSLPFLLMNDYRLSLITNSLQRSQLLKKILVSGL